MQQNAKHSRPNVLPQPEWSGHNVLIPEQQIMLWNEQIGQNCHFFTFV